MNLHAAEKNCKSYSNSKHVLEAAERARELVKQILTFSRQTEHERKPVQVAPIVHEAIKLLLASIPATIEMKHTIENDETIHADPTQIHQVIMNLCTNAFQAMQEKGGVLTINLSDTFFDEQAASSHSDLSPGHYVTLTVSDTGSGINPKIIDRIFDPFFTTKAAGQGTGMGLSVVHGIIIAHGGAIKVHSEPGRGTVFNISLPKIEETVKSSAVEALDAFRQNSDTFHLVITDYAMPRMNGYDLTKEILSIRPDIPVLLCTGIIETVTIENAGRAGVHDIIMKPLMRKDVAIAVRRVLDSKKSVDC